jgi:hypothetical protein
MPSAVACMGIIWHERVGALFRWYPTRLGQVGSEANKHLNVLQPEAANIAVSTVEGCKTAAPTVEASRAQVQHRSSACDKGQQ